MIFALEKWIKARDPMRPGTTGAHHKPALLGALEVFDKNDMLNDKQVETMEKIRNKEMVIAPVRKRWPTDDQIIQEVGEQGVCSTSSIASVFGYTFSGMQRRLQLLQEAGKLCASYQGKRKFYRVSMEEAA